MAEGAENRAETGRERPGEAGDTGTTGGGTADPIGGGPDPGIVYVLTNEGMPDLVKIGTTGGSLEGRIANLSNHTGIPVAFECFFAARVKDAGRIERALHRLFSEYRFNSRREFFSVEPEKAVLAIGIGDFEEVTPGRVDIGPGEQEALENIKSRRKPIRLSAIGINPGDELIFSRDTSVRATVVDDNTVELEGETIALSPAALKVLNRSGSNSTAASGSQYWTFEGELLDERRRRLESERFD